MIDQHLGIHDRHFLGRDGASHHETASEYYATNKGVVRVTWGTSKLMHPDDVRANLNRMLAINKESIGVPHSGAEEMVSILEDLIVLLDSWFSPVELSAGDRLEYQGVTYAVVVINRGDETLWLRSESSGRLGLCPRYLVLKEAKKLEAVAA